MKNDKDSTNLFSKSNGNTRVFNSENEKLKTKIIKKMVNYSLNNNQFKLEYYPLLLYYNFKKLAYHIFGDIKSDHKISEYLKCNNTQKVITFKPKITELCETSGFLIDEDLENTLKAAIQNSMKKDYAAPSKKQKLEWKGKNSFIYNI